ncbi:hypothetical protein BGW36DRAFT_372668 [Talaromyces proteolyticus]|uniref:Zn(2)-C6 fungal-type domain-containing protein n=1 Tax=Talaromyces proteolyticus TaxID=1131652 RepID=A0AAD4KXJ1_9EURO|nr:uncharacterized protein BGW36DRAFT_372668 [Talaromyces proteolyticus]KAH8702354.1 hypothetical protein BGW36DRAFT_372668 [Talaromyces proteolyticus]
MSADDLRPPKRTKQACEPCRRKKSRCPGERPACSYCERLGQPCEYGDTVEEGSEFSKKMEDRISGIETKLEAMLECFTQQSARSHMLSPARTLRSGNLRSGTTDNLPRQIIFSSAQTFLWYCNHQPIPFFHSETFLSTVSARDVELIDAIQALALRFEEGGFPDHDINQQIQNKTESSRKAVMNRIAEGTVELSTLQSLCLLSMIDFTAGNIIRAEVNMKLARLLMNNLKMGKDEYPINLESETDEKVLCHWSIHMLGNLICDPSQLTATESSHIWNELNIPQPIHQSKVSAFGVGQYQNHSDLKRDNGLLANILQLSEIWMLARKYTSIKKNVNSPPPWSPQSDYSIITFRHIEYESQSPLKYRLHASRFPEMSAASLNQKREYWGPWLFLQLVYHAIPCLLNHPFLLSVRLKNFRQTMPQSFLRNSFEQITLHAGWILYFVDLLQEKDFEVSDPTLGHCVAIVATIYLQHSFVEEVAFREKAQASFEKCLNFLQRMATRWPHIEKQVKNLLHLRNSISGSRVPNIGQQSNRNSHQGWTVNVHLLCEILEYNSASKASDPSGDIFGSGLVKDSIAYYTSTPASPTPDLDFALIGTPGLSGHKTVANELVTYPPDELQRIDPNMSQISPPNIDLSGLIGDQGFDAFDASESSFLQPQEYGRAIENWLNFNVR